jgi:uncharacterized tellurite resistance protein B-like protein
MEFTKKEKMSMVKMIDYVILADSKVAPGEMNLLTQLMERFNFDTFFIGQARNLKKVKALEILGKMELEKKKVVAKVLDEVAISDGFLHEKEINLIMETLQQIGVDKELS